MKRLIVTLRKHYPKKSKPITGILSVMVDNKNDNALFEDMYGNMHGELLRPKLKWTNGVGIFLEGLEAGGYFRDGSPKYKFQEWYCTFDRVEGSIDK